MSHRRPRRHTPRRGPTTVPDPAAFGRLALRLLREGGFVSAEVAGRSGGGIDGEGVAPVAGVLGFHVGFQCERDEGVRLGGAGA